MYPLTTLKESSKTGVLNGKNFCNLLKSRGRESRHLITDELSRNLAQKYDFSIDALVQVAIHMAADKLFEVTKMEHLKYAVAVAVNIRKISNE